jgi:hypothetical protein
MATDCEEVDWNHVAWDKDKLRALVKRVMNYLASIQGKEFLDELSDY